ncbi:MAG TPA: AI-2E family transporter [Terriglobia bacterium]|nr:AI-2E family transporter [Terriglobia bacterium]
MIKPDNRAANRTLPPPTAQLRNRFTLVFLALASFLMLVLCYIMARSFLAAILFAVVMAVAFYPVHARIWTRIRGPNKAAFVSTLVVLTVVVLPVVALAHVVTGEIRDAYTFLAVRSSESGGLIPWVTTELQKPLEAIGRHVDLNALNLRGELQARLEEWSASIVRSAADIARHLGSFLLNAAISFFALFFLFREGRRVRLTMAALLPLDTGRVDRLFTSIGDTIIANVYGVLAVAVAQAALTGAALAALGVGSPVLLGVLTAGCSLVPVFGASLVWLPASIVLVASGHWVKGLILLIWGAAVVSTSDHIIRTYIVGGRVKMNTFFVFLSLLGGIEAFGILGIFIGPLILSVTAALLGMLHEEMRDWQKQEPPESPAADTGLAG